MSRYMILNGNAQTPITMPWIKNAKLTRSSDEALALSENHGIEFPVDPPDEEVILVLCDKLPEDIPAAYLLPAEIRENELWPWKRFLNRFGDVIIRIKSFVFESDEAIVAVLAHEAYELNKLRELLPDGEALKAPDLYQLIAPGIDGNLHCQAWDAADERILAWRQARSSQQK